MLSIHISFDQVKRKVNECRRIKGKQAGRQAGVSEKERGKTIYILIFMTQFFFILRHVIRINSSSYDCFVLKIWGNDEFEGWLVDKQENHLTDDYLKICGFLCLSHHHTFLPFLSLLIKSISISIFHEIKFINLS